MAIPAHTTLSQEQIATIKQALDAAKNVCNNTYGYDEQGQRDETDTIESEYSAADIFEQVCNIEPIVDEALTCLTPIIRGASL